MSTFPCFLHLDCMLLDGLTVKAKVLRISSVEFYFHYFQHILSLKKEDAHLQRHLEAFAQKMSPRKVE